MLYPESMALMKRAIEARQKKQELERQLNFHVWLEEAFGIEDYRKITRERPRALVDQKILFVRAEGDEMAAEVYVECHLCDDPERYFIGVINSLEQLGNYFRLSRDGKPFLISKEHSCGKIRSKLAEIENVQTV